MLVTRCECFDTWLIIIQYFLSVYVSVSLSNVMMCYLCLFYIIANQYIFLFWTVGWNKPTCSHSKLIKFVSSGRELLYGHFTCSFWLDYQNKACWMLQMLRSANDYAENSGHVTSPTFRLHSLLTLRQKQDMNSDLWMKSPINNSLNNNKVTRLAVRDRNTTQRAFIDI